MIKRLRNILLIMLMIAATQAAGQYIIDKVCVGSVRYYRVDGEQGSTYAWKLTDPFSNVINLPSTADTVAITWSMAPGIYKLSTVQHSAVTNCYGILEIGDIEVFDQPTAFAGANRVYCTPDPYQMLDATALHYRSLLWTTSGDGTFDNDTILHPVYSPGIGDLNSGMVTLTLTAQGLGNGNSCIPAVSPVIIHQSATIVGVTATATPVSCFGGNNGTATAFPTGGTGTYTYLWNDPAAQTTITATGLFAGTYKVVVTDANGCSDSASATVTQPAAALSAVITSYSNVSCFGYSDGSATVTVTGGTTPYSYLWNTVPPQTTPTASNLVAGLYIVTVTDSNFCVSIDSVTITQPPSIMANAGPDALICETVVYTLSSATAANYSTLSWATSGDGLFNDASVLNPTYIPGTADIASGMVILTLTAHGIGQCPDSTDLMVLSISRQAVVNAGPDATICETEGSYILSAATGSHYTSLMWTTTGTGTFSSQTALNPVYTPSMADISGGSVILALTATSAAPCITVSDSMVLTIIPRMTASAGPDGTTCNNIPFTVTGSSATNYSSILWTHNGTGTLLNETTIHPTYVASATESGVVTLTMKVISIPPCTDSIIDQMNLTIWAVPGGTISGNFTVCENDSVVLTLTFYGSPPISVTYTNGADTTTINNIMTSPYAIVIVPPPGNWVYTLIAMNDIHCAAPPDKLLGEAHVIVNPLPAVDFTWNIGNQNNEIQFHIDPTVTNLGAIGNMCLWNFGDGTYGYGHDPLHVYAVANTYNVTLTVTDSLGCSNSVTHQVGVPSMPAAFFSSDSPACLGGEICFINLSTQPAPPDHIITYIWHFGDASPDDTIHFPDNPDICHLYSTADTFAVTLKVIDNNGFSDTFTADVIVIPAPAANFNYTSTLCPGQYVNFTDATLPNGGGGISSWNWNFGDPGSGLENTSALQNPSHIFLHEDSTYHVTLIVTNYNNCADTVVKPVSIHPKPPVDFAYGTACMDQPVSFAADTMITHPDSIAGWSWNFGDGTPPVSDPVSTSHTFHTAGVFQVTLTITDIHSCTNSVTHIVEVNPLPVAAFTWNAPACQGSAVQFTDHSDVSGMFQGYIAKWVWDFGDGTSQTIVLPASPNVTHVFAGTGPVYLVRLTVWTNDSCSSYIEHQVSILPKPTAAFDYSTVNCTDQPVQFTDLSQTNGGGNIASWSWNFGDPASGTGNTSNLQNPSHLFAASGAFLVRLTVTNVNNCFDTISKVIIINVKPVADFAADTACLGNPTTFTNLSLPNAPAIISYSWNFGDGSALNPQTNPVHTYLSGGLFTVTLSIVNSNGCANSVTKQVLVNPLPTAAFIFTSPVCQGAQACFDDVSTTPPGYLGYITRWTWNFGDGTSQTIVAPANPDVCHVFAGAAPAYTVRLTVTTSDSCSHFTEHTVTIVTAPVAGFSYSAITCAGQAVEFNDLSQLNGGGPISSWSWNFGDPLSGANNTSALQDPSHTFASGGMYTVTLIIRNLNNCSDTVSMNIQINLPPVADFTADTACAGNSTTFTDLSVANAASFNAWLWNFGDGTPAGNTQNPTHSYAGPGVYTVILTVTNSNGCISSVTKQVAVNPLPVAAFSFPVATCQGAPACFVDMSTVPPGYLGNIVQWTWNFGDGTPDVTILLPANPNACHTFTGTALSHIVRLTVTTSDGCINYAEHTVAGSPAPSAGFTYTTATCQGKTAGFTDTSQPTGGISITEWNWNFGDPVSGANNFSTLQNPSHLFIAAGNYTVTLIVKNLNLCSDTISHIVNVSMAPVADFNADTACLGTPTHFTDQSLPNAPSIASWSWNFGDGTSPSLNPNPSHTYIAYGTYNVTLTVVNSSGCTKDTTRVIYVRPLPVPGFTYTNPHCVGTPVFFTDQSVILPGSNDPVVQWAWDFGDGTTPTTISYPASPDISHIFSGNALTHNVQLTAYTLSGCQATAEHIVNSIPAPVAGFTFPATSCSMQPVQFTDQTQLNGGGPVISWNWNFGDPGSGAGNISNEQNPLHAFSNGGTFVVTLIVSNAGACSDTVQKQVVMSALPVASFTSDSACLGSVTTFTDHSTVPAGSGLILSHSWEFGDGQTSTQTNPTHLYAGAGIYDVTLTVTTTHGCTKDTTIQALVHVLPTASFSYSSNTCEEDSILFTDLSTIQGGSIARWKWEFGDGQSKTIIFPDPPNVRHAYANPGTYNVVLTVTSTDSCSDDRSLPVTVYPKPQAEFTYSAIDCQFMPVQFTDLSQGAGGYPVAGWSWNFGDPGSGTQNNSGLQNPSHTYSTPGTYQVSLVATNSTGCIDSIVHPVVVNAAPVAQFTADTACAGGPTHFTDGSLPGSGTLAGWQWNFGDPGSGVNNTSSQQDPVHIYGAPGSYTVTLVVTNSHSCVNDTVIPVLVSPAPDAMFTYMPACTGDYTRFTDQSVAPNSQLAGWSWDFGDGGTSSQQNPLHVYQNPGNYNVRLTVTNLGGCSDSIVLPVVARPKPVASFTYTSLYCPAGQVMFQDLSHGTGSSIAQRLWIFEPGQTSTLPNPVHKFSATGTTFIVTLIVTDTYGCMDTVQNSVYVKEGFAFTFASDSACFGNPTHFAPQNLAPGDSLYFITWNFGDPASGANNISNDYNAVHTFSKAGTFIVMMKASNRDNCTDSVYRSVEVRGLPQVRFTSSSEPCNNVVHFNESSIPVNGLITQWEWTFGDGTPPLVINAPGTGDTSHTYAHHGEYQVFLKVTNSLGCTGIITKPVHALPCISAGFTQDDPVCARTPLTFADSSHPVSAISGWHWYWGDGSDTAYSVYAATLKHEFAVSGKYLVKLLVNAVSGGVPYTDSAAQFVTVTRSPLASFTLTDVCLSGTTLFHDESDIFGDQNTGWKWNFGDPSSGSLNTSTVRNPSHRYDTAGTYQVKLVLMNSTGCSDTLVRPARVFGLPDARFSSTNACKGNPTNFTDRSLTADTSIMTWRWNFGVAGTMKDTSRLQDPVYQYNTEGEYLVRMIVTDQNSCTDTVDSTIRVNATPVSAFTITDNYGEMPGRIKLNNQSQGATGYEWEFGNGGSSTEENPVVTYAMDGTYLIMLVTSNQFNCTDTTYYNYEMIFKGLYIPNAFAPASSNTAIRLFKPAGRNLKEYNIQVYDYMGHMLWESSALDADGRPAEGWDGMYNGKMMPQATYMWKARAVFTDGSVWQGSDIGKGDYKTIGTVSLIR